MTDEQKFIRYYTPEMVDMAMNIWMRSSVSLIDIRNKRVERSKPLENYQLPTSMFIYTHGAPASILLNHEPYQTERYGLCHASKGSLLSIAPVESDVETFMILYKAEAPPLYKRHLRNLMKTINPFIQLYGFTPANPIFFMEKCYIMLESWNKKESTDQFHAKALLYQFVHQVYVELKQGDVRYMEPDYVEWVKEYMDKHFAEPLSIQALSDRLPMNRSVLARLFRKRENSSMQEYLIRKRIEVAKAYLVETNASIQEIAYGSGFTDEFNLIRMFKRYMHVSPSQYRHKRSIDYINKDIDNDSHIQYNEKELASLVNSYKEGESTMFGHARSKELILAAAMSMMLLLSACTSGNPASNGGTVNTVPAQTQQTTYSEASEMKAPEAVAETRIISTVKGDVEVPNNPQRVIVDYLVGDVVALGVTPHGVARAARSGTEAVFASQITDSIKIAMEPEDVMTLDPDLIILAWGDENYEELSKIAPTIYVPYGDMTAEERIHFIGDVLNKQEEAEAVWKAYTDKIEDAKRAIKSAGLSDATVTIGEFSDKDSAIAGAKHAVGELVYNEFQMRPPSKVQTDIIDADSYWGNISLELLAAYTGDYLISLGKLSINADHAVWKSLPAVQNNRIIVVDEGLSWSTDVMTSSALIDHIVKQLLALLE